LIQFSSVCFWPLCGKSTGCRCMGLFLGSVLCSLVLRVWFYTGTMLFWLLLWLCSMSWNHTTEWCLQLCTFCPRWLSLLSIFCASMLIRDF
jgi:hypothetical protein